MRTLVIGGTGKVGSGVVAQLREAGHQAVPASRGGEGGVSLDVADAGAVRAAAEGFDAAFLITPVGPDEAAIGVAAVGALKAAGVRKIVFLGIHRLREMTEIPHFAAKVPIVDSLGAGDVALSPSFFMQNDRMALPAITQGGVYSLPVGSVGVSSIDVGDIATAGVRALTTDEWDGQAVPLCGPDVLTGPGMAAVWGEALGRPIHYAGDDTGPFLAQMGQMPGFDQWMADDFRLMMEVTQAQGNRASEDDLAATRAIVGRPLTTYPDFVRTTLQGAPA